MKSSKYKLKYFLLKNKKLFILFLLFAILTGVFGGLDIIFTTGLFNAIVEKNLDQIIYNLSILLVSLLLWVIFYLSVEYVKEILVKKIRSNMRDVINQKMIDSNVSFVSLTSDSKYLSLINNDLTIIEEKYLNSYFSILRVIIGTIASFVSFFILSPVVGAIITILGISNIFIPYFSKKYLEKKTEKFSRKNEEYNSKILRYLSIFNFIVINSKNKFFRKKTYDANKTISKEVKKYENIQWNIKSMQFFFTILLSWVLLALCIVLFFNGWILVGIFASVLFQGYELLNNMRNLATDYISFNSVRQFFSKPFSYFAENAYEEKGKKPIPNFNSKIEFQSYKSKLNNKKLIDPWNITFEKGKKHIITGENGIGKSVLLKSLLNINEKYEGQIEIDNLNVKDIKRNDLNNLILYNSNKTFLLDNKNLNQNIAFNDSEKLDLIKLQKAIKEANLDFYDEKLVINENSNNLSQGQVQRIGLARAFYFDREIQIYDESLSNLDPHNRTTILKNILAKKDKTIIVIAHHLESKYLSLFDHEINLSSL